ncbi:enoyl-CoA hydratase [Crenalkalicoccus roseus]|uniref:enoyl-CoA hydratase n=1 Tax=Crenalkalicoccus roseus TaxID=1485588 RepID=UPI0010804F8B|nr:enoyl-CoA hydratase [Crenalkalicoccus roseus]
MSEHIRVSTADGVCRIEMHRPEKKNALTRAMYDAMADALEGAARDEAVRCVLFAGAGDAFTAGNDINDFRNRPQDGGVKPASRVYSALVRYEKPVVAAVGGLAIGIGTTMLLHCDIVIAAEEARFRTPFVDLGVVPELGSSLLLPRLCGRHRAAELLLLGDFFDARRAAEIGLVNRVVPRAELEATAMEVARRLADKPPAALRLTKSLLCRDQEEILARIEEEGALFAQRLLSPETQAILAGVLKPKA